MDAFPAFFPLAGRRVVIAGQGDAAESKARLFEGSPTILVRLGRAEAVRAEAYAGAALAFVADGDEAFVTAAAAAARMAGVAVNVVDHPALCDFITPALVDRGEVVAAVATTGAAPMLAAQLRNDLEAAIPEGAGRVAALFRQSRDEIRAALPDLARRRAFLREALSGPAAEAAMRGDMAGAAALLREALAGDDLAVHAGRFCVIDGSGPADLLSLRASRALSLAEILIPDPDCAPSVLGLARRDARRLAPDEIDLADMIEFVRDGAQVVRLVASAPDPAMLDAFAAAGIAVERLRVAAG
ncbi:MAG TPA: NAD(P)-dependent oxidoreductase [Caulobacteraceae bacterium]|jgi:precorrin-2 dehydrogenase/sirohydrochlorin ferrochelatase|nr:NAD(P)-dependent oxidoreductase [Caulobacteraceae bacterium]